MANSFPLKAILESMIEQELIEANPYGYLSKTAKPQGQAQWDPKAQQAFADKQKTQDFRQKGIRDENDPIVKINAALSSATPEQLQIIANVLNIGTLSSPQASTDRDTKTK